MGGSPNPTDRSCWRLRSFARPQTPSDLRRQPGTPPLQTCTRKSLVWTRTYFLKVRQVLCRQKQDVCIETQVSGLIYATVGGFLTVPSSHIFVPRRIQGRGPSWKRKQISQVPPIQVLKGSQRFAVLTAWKSSERERNEQQGRKFHPAVLEGLEGPCEAGLSRVFLVSLL